jgi:hypothetical protein
MAEKFSNLIVEGVFRSDPFWMFCLHLVPEPVCEVRVELTVWMESVASFDHLLWITAFHDFSFEDFHGWEIVVNQIKVLEFVALVYDLLVDFRKILGPLGSESSDGFVSVEPSPARADLEAVQEIINISISNIQRMSPVMQVIIKQLTISQSQNH